MKRKGRYRDVGETDRCRAGVAMQGEGRLVGGSRLESFLFIRMRVEAGGVGAARRGEAELGG